MDRFRVRVGFWTEVEFVVEIAEYALMAVRHQEVEVERTSATNKK